jgi:hypothetical protein
MDYKIKKMVNSQRKSLQILWKKVCLETSSQVSEPPLAQKVQIALPLKEVTEMHFRVISPHEIKPLMKVKITISVLGVKLRPVQQAMVVRSQVEYIFQDC